MPSFPGIDLVLPKLYDKVPNNDGNHEQQGKKAHDYQQFNESKSFIHFDFSFFCVSGLLELL